MNTGGWVTGGLLSGGGFGVGFGFGFVGVGVLSDFFVFCFVTPKLVIIPAVSKVAFLSVFLEEQSLAFLHTVNDPGNSMGFFISIRISDLKNAIPRVGVPVGAVGAKTNP